MSTWLKYESWDMGIVVIPMSCIFSDEVAILGILIKNKLFLDIFCVHAVSKSQDEDQKL